MSPTPLPCTPPSAGSSVAFTGAVLEVPKPEELYAAAVSWSSYVALVTACECVLSDQALTRSTALRSGLGRRCIPAHSQPHCDAWAGEDVQILLQTECAIYTCVHIQLSPKEGAT